MLRTRPVRSDPMSPLVIDKNAKKQEILNAALSAFAQNGVKNTKMADIAKVAGIGKGTIYEYFRSKDAVLAGAFEFFLEKIGGESEAFAHNVPDPEAQLCAFIQGAFDAATRNAELMKLMFDIWAESIREGTELDIKGMYERYRAVIRTILEAGIASKQFRPVDSQLTAATLIAAMDGLMLQWVMDEAAFDLQGMSLNLTDTFLHGILAT